MRARRSLGETPVAGDESMARWVGPGVTLGMGGEASWIVGRVEVTAIDRCEGCWLPPTSGEETSWPPPRFNDELAPGSSLFV
jgi:hypothetical protein